MATVAAGLLRVSDTAGEFALFAGAALLLLAIFCGVARADEPAAWEQEVDKAVEAQDKLYKWVDENGVVHYSAEPPKDREASDATTGFLMHVNLGAGEQIDAAGVSIITDA